MPSRPGTGSARKRAEECLLRWGPAVFFAAAFVLLWVFLERTQQYAFRYREQQQVFLLDWHYVQDLLRRPCGFSLAVSQFLVQFFPVPYVGSGVTALLGTLGGASLWAVCRRIRDDIGLLPLCLLPSLLLLTVLTDTYLSYQELVAFVLAVFLVRLYGSCCLTCRIGTRICAGALITLLAHFACGPFTMTVVAPGILLLDLFTHRGKGLWQLIQPLLGLLLGVAGILGGELKGLQDVFLCGMFYEALLEAPFGCNLCWIAALSCLAVFALCSFIRRIPVAADLALGLLLAVLAAFLFKEGVRKTMDQREYTAERMYVLFADGQWDALLQDPAAHYNHPLITNMVNVALSRKGTLLEEMFAYPQEGPRSLLDADEGSLDTVPLLQVISLVHYHFGNVACAQNLGFDTFVGQRFGHPTMLKLLVKTHLVTGSYDVAEKYITRLEKTWRYADWARSMRRFLRDDAAVENDPELGTKRRDLPVGDKFLFTHGVYSEMQDILAANPSDRVARDYQLALLLLMKQVSEVRHFVETYYGTAVLPELPSLVQQALVVASEDNLDWCRSHGVGSAVLTCFDQFRQRYAAALRAGEKPAQALRREFGSTFWYYYLFKEFKV